MDQSNLLSSSVELCLKLLEKNGGFRCFCKAIDAAGETFIYMEDSEVPCTEKKTDETVRYSVKREIHSRNLAALAVCANKSVHFADSSDEFSAIKVEMHYADQPGEIYYFRYVLSEAKATILEYHTKEFDVTNLFAT